MGRRPGTLGVVGSAVIAAAALSGCGLGRGDPASEQRSTTYDDQITAVSFEDLAASDVRVRTGSGSSVQVNRTLRYVDGDTGTKPTVRETVDDGTLRIGYTCPDGADVCGVDYDVVVPESTAIIATVTSGDLDLAGLAGSLYVSTTSGDVVADGLRTPEVTAKTTSGDVRLTFTAPPSSLTATATSGDIELRLPQQTYAVQTKSDSGDVTVDVDADQDADRSVTATATSGDVSVTTT